MTPLLFLSPRPRVSRLRWNNVLVMVLCLGSLTGCSGTQDAPSDQAFATATAKPPHGPTVTETQLPHPTDTGASETQQQPIQPDPTDVRGTHQPEPTSTPATETQHAPQTSAPTVEPHTLLATYPHDHTSFTQGLELHNGVLYESRGLVGHSTVTMSSPTDATAITNTVELPPAQFGEGITIADNRIYTLTWQAGQAHVYDANTLTPVTTFPYAGQGWGICYTDEGTLVMSDGSSMLTTRDLEMHPLGSIEVTRDGTPLPRLNELECVGKYIYANVWLTNEIVIIERHTGQVVRTFNLSDLVPDLSGLPEYIAPRDAVLNGIAHTPDGAFLVTGKGWPVMYKVALPTP